MDTLIINSQKKTDTKLLLELVKKMGLQSKKLTNQEKNDWHLVQKINSGMKTTSVSKEEVMKLLKKK